MMIATTTIQRLTWMAAFGWLLVDSSSSVQAQQPQPDELPTAMLRALQSGAGAPECCQWICPTESSPTYHHNGGGNGSSKKDKYDKGSKHSTKDTKDKAHYEKDSGYWRRHLMTQKQGGYPPAGPYYYNEDGCYQDCSACSAPPYMPPPPGYYGPPPGYYGPPPGYYPPPGGWYGGYPGGPYPPPPYGAPPDDGYYYYYNSMKKSDKKMGMMGSKKSGGGKMGGSGSKMGMMGSMSGGGKMGGSSSSGSKMGMSGKGSYSYWPDPDHDSPSDDNEGVCCHEWRANCSYVDDSSSSKMNKSKRGRQEICVPYCAVPCDDDDDDYELPPSGCTDLPTFVDPSGCDCQCTCCDGGDPEPDDDYDGYSDKNKMSKKHRHLGKSGKISKRGNMSYPSGGMYKSPKSPPTQNCQCRCQCPDYPYPPGDGSHPKGSTKDKGGSYKDGSDKDGYYPKDGSNKDKGGSYKDGSDKDGYYPKDGSNKDKGGSYKDESKKSHKQSTYRYSVDVDEKKSKKTPKVEKRGEKMEYPKYPLAKDHARTL